LNKNVFGPGTAKENGMAKNQAFVKAALTDWLFCVFWDITYPTKGSRSGLTRSIGSVSN
jgi:hypothetical protein